jgi:transposase
VEVDPMTMMQHRQVRYIGLDVHKATIAVAIADEAGAPSSYGSIANDPSAIRKLMTRLGGPDIEVRVAYEAGPTGYALYRQLSGLNIACLVVAPSLIPKRPGERVKTDRRDALKLARLLRSGDLTPVWVPDEAHEALRNLVRARADAKADQLRAKHRLSKLLLRQGVPAAALGTQLVAALLSVAAAAALRSACRPDRLRRLPGRSDCGW